MLLRLIRSALLAALVLLPATTASAASLWTPLPTGTTQQITAIATPKTGELVFTTAVGQIRYLTSGGTFAAATVTPAPPLGFTDVAMSADGVDGVAVGAGGAIYRSTNSGVTWAPIATAPQEYNSKSCNTGGTLAPISDDLFSVKFADATTVYVTGADADVLKSTDAGQHFTEVNKVPGNNADCIADVDGAFTDSAWTSASVGFLLSNGFGGYFATTNGFTSASARGGENVNGFGGTDKLALDLDNPSDAWGVGSTGMGGSYFSYTTNAGNAWSTPTFDDNNVSFQDIADVGTTVVAVGLSGDIYTSSDGVNFSRQVAAAPYSANDWHAVSMVPGTTDAFVGGAGGVMVFTTKANQLPDTTPPTGTIAGPTKLAPQQFGNYTVSATDNPGGSGVNSASFVWSTPGQPNQTGPTARFAFSSAGNYGVSVSFTDLAGNPKTVSITVVVKAPPPSGSGQVTKKSGGTTVGIFKKVTVTGRSARFIPVKLATKKPRQFIVTLLTKKGNHALATLTVKLKKGHKTVHLKIPAKIKSGTYKLVVVVLTTGKHSHPVGAKIKQVFVLS